MEIEIEEHYKKIKAWSLRIYTKIYNPHDNLYNPMVIQYHVFNFDAF